MKHTHMRRLDEVPGYLRHQETIDARALLYPFEEDFESYREEGEQATLHYPLA
jgi:hypothetical protein